MAEVVKMKSQISKWVLAKARQLAGCPIVERHAVPKELTNDACIAGIPDGRFWADEWPEFAKNEFDTFTESDFLKHHADVYNKPHNYLAISGGGANGAFGAGLLLGWTASGTRPEFSMVTGISTGSLTAPFAFLGKDYDNIIKEIYTITRTQDLVKDNNIFAILLGDSLSSTKPLGRMLVKYITEEVMDAIAKQHQRGRRLFIGTHNLDACRSVIWNIGAIANSTHPDKLKLIHAILLASASIPVAFPPVIIPVTCKDKIFDEMHVDGGAGSQVFIYPAGVDWKHIIKKLKVHGRPKVFIIRNSFLKSDYNGMQRGVLSIASRTISSLIRTQGIGDLYQMYTICKRDDNDFNLAYIPSSFTESSEEKFDPIYMQKLFDLGYQMSSTSYTWGKYPPYFNLDE